MENIFEVIDKTGRKIRLTEEQWRHIKREHPEVNEEDIKLTLQNPLKIIDNEDSKYFYCQYLKHKKLPFRYIRVIVKYLNGGGFVITAYFVKNIT